MKGSSRCNATAICPDCNRQFSGPVGVRIHRAARHRPQPSNDSLDDTDAFVAHEVPSLGNPASPPLMNSQQTIPKALFTSNDSPPVPPRDALLEFRDSNWRVTWANGLCPVCHHQFKGAQGVRVHISNSHPQLSQEMKLSRRERRVSHDRRTNTRSNNSQPSQSIPSGIASGKDTLSTSSSSSTDHSDSAAHPPTAPSLEPWDIIFNALLSRPKEEDISSDFDKHVNDFAVFLADAVNSLPGPKHPSTRFYQARRRTGGARRAQAKFQRSSNPLRSDRRRKKKTRERYSYELAQFNYRYIRKRAVHTVLNPHRKNTCQIPLPTVEEHCGVILGEANDNIRESYPFDRTLSDEGEDDGIIRVGEIEAALLGMSTDTSPGPDRVLLRVVKSLQCAKILSLIATIMYQRSIVPAALRSGRTVLIAKEGDPSHMKNWRPITIFSVLRRIIERVLDKRLRDKVIFSTSQRGFVSVPGTHINSSIINGALHSATGKQKNCAVVFLDISRAFDNIGHEHLRRTLESYPIPVQLRSLLLALCVENTIQVEVGPNKTRPIKMKRGVPQGAPISPVLFNLCIDFILKELLEDSISREYGYFLDDTLPGLTVMAFADDIAIIAKDVDSAQRLIELVMRGLQSIGLNINPVKSKVILIKDGKLTPSETGLQLLTGETIPTLHQGERIRYLGIDFTDEIVLDELRVMRDLKTKLDLVTNSPLLHSDQKLTIVNQFIWPTLIYPLQSAPLCALKSGFLEDIDKLIRGAVKQICSLPMDTPNAMMYSSRKHRGLGVFRASWEAFLQHVNLAQKLASSSDPHLQVCRDFQDEQRRCLAKLDLSGTHEEDSAKQPETNFPSAKTLRIQLREREFERWCALPYKGQGVALFQEFPESNRWVSERNGLTGSEWTNALKMSTNGCNLRSNPRTAPSTTRCRHCSEIETLPHVLGSCPRGELLRTRRHHRVCDSIAEDLRARGLTVIREDHTVTDLGSRYSDLVALNAQASEGFILDPTVRFERSPSQAEEVDHEKRATYEPTLDTYRDRYPHIKDWLVVGLLFGARGAIPALTVNTLRGHFNITKAALQKISINIIKDSLGILHHHMYTREHQ